MTKTERRHVEGLRPVAVTEDGVHRGAMNRMQVDGI